MVFDLIKQDSAGTFALLVDPDKYSIKDASLLAGQAEENGVDIILLGGSLIRKSMEKALLAIKEATKIPIVLFPGSVFQLCPRADAILLLSLISGRNPEFLIGNHVVAAHTIKESGMEVIPTGYILIDSGSPSSVQYMSNTTPIPSNKADIVVATALAGEQLGLKVVYLEGGSGAKLPISTDVISEVKKNISLPIIVGGGLRTPEQVREVRKAGASMVVVGNALERNGKLLQELVIASR
ncbi:MAG: geranylgeranylglyceryl/heptaprenylglyceryl phosphate synthase [Bacteroidetes bacterium HGW-Bacteroidetes-15]|nr:MAG: geranylgeranylglyceryl/heptaprenylglyceryl phosphate synthase [Bacteroidetes bacterium HGW-Bacteroidetes-15]